MALGAWSLTSIEFGEDWEDAEAYMQGTLRDAVDVNDRDAAGIAALVPDLAERSTWACGPVGMLEALGVRGDQPSLGHFAAEASAETVRVLRTFEDRRTGQDTAHDKQRRGSDAEGGVHGSCGTMPGQDDPLGREQLRGRSPCFQQFIRDGFI